MAVFDLRETVVNCSRNQACSARTIGLACAASDTGLNFVEGANSTKHMRCNGRGTFDVNVVELASGVRTATGLYHATRFIHFVVTGERVGLQDAGVILQMGLGEDAAPIRRVTYPHGWCRRVATGPIIAGIDPQACLTCLAGSRRKYVDRLSKLGLHNDPRPELVRMDYDMPDGVLHVKVRAANAGYMLRSLSIDCSPDHSLEGPEYFLWLKDPLALYGASNAKLAPGYKDPRAAILSSSGKD